ncbi:MauE/DoxX family redox-associated membrane protein [Variovorax sp. OV084]|jgi:glutaredoxin|uniref:MauE/DoxX family redox-associated membrane protein n=1 Tax=Variovorax sp. OV084 TaxID=1882777 RepID=UPI0008AFA64C|nr:MauE/DoxX family redox-associated membrane protein [Variovorax sp. OV084]SEU23240.1 Glutaredoxin [Variovorax sp. OV084]
MTTRTADNNLATGKTATLYRMVIPEHICPFGLKARFLLRRKGYQVDDRWLMTRTQTDAFKAEHHVQTTPQIFIEGHRIGGYDDLRRHFGLPVRNPGEASYTPVIAVLVVALLLAGASLLAANRPLGSPQLLSSFISFTMCILALLKLQDVESFSTMFLNYDLLARRFVLYAYLYPFAELLAGVLMVAGRLHEIAVPVALFVGSVGAMSVVKAVYVDHRELKCACVGGSSNVPLGFVSLTENLMMVAIALWVIVDA